MTVKNEVLKYIKNKMSASPGQVLDLIPEEIQDQIFSVSNRSRRSGMVCHAIYSLIGDGAIFEDKGRYYISKEN